MRRVGLDLALKAPHRAAVFDDAQRVGRSFCVERSKAGMEMLLRRATAGSSDGKCEFVMEPTGLAWLPVAAELAHRGHRVFVPKPQKTSALRKFYSAFAKTDAIDSAVGALVRHVDPTGVHELKVPTVEEMTLRLCTKQRARLVIEAAKSKGRIQSWLVLANPDLSDTVDLFSDLGTALLRRYVDPFKVQAMGKAELRRFCQRQVRGALDDKQMEAIWRACQTTCELYEGLRAAKRLPFDYGVLQMLVSQELERLEFLEQQAQRLELTIGEAYSAVDPERMLEREVPGIGTIIAPAIEAYAGDVERFTSAKRFAAFFGLVPRTRQTGGGDGKPHQRLTKGGPRLLKQYLYLAAETARRCDPELAAAYAQAIARGKHHYSSVIIVAHKLLRKIYALLKLRAAARRALTEGRPAPSVSYRYRRPEDGVPLTLEQARAYVRAHFPSKATKAAKQKKAAEAKPQRPPGSSEDATNAICGTPPEELLAQATPCGKPGIKIVDNLLETKAQFPVDGS